jgi:hypothetical protein
MMPTNIDRSKVVSMLASLGFVLVLGCGDDTGLGRRYPVSGTIRYQGKPVEKGLISFRPTDPAGRAAGGTIAAGMYSLETAGNRDGALPGTYKVSIIARDVDVAKALAEAKAKNPRVPWQLAEYEAQKKGKSLVPTKYNSPETAGLTREVKEQSNRIDFELTD